MDMYKESMCLFIQLVAKRKRHLNNLLQDFDLCPLEGKIIYLLSKAPEKTLKISAILKKYSLDNGQLSRAIKNLEGRNIVYLEDDLDDKRSKYIKLNRSADVLKSFKAKFWKNFNSEFLELNAEEILVFKNYLQRMVNNNDKYNTQ